MVYVHLRVILCIYMQNKYLSFISEYHDFEQMKYLNSLFVCFSPRNMHKDIRDSRENYSLTQPINSSYVLRIKGNHF